MPERLTDLYNQLQGVMSLLRDIVQPGKVEEGTALYASGSSPPADAGSRYRFEKRGKESWAVLDSRKGDALLALTKYKKGAESLMDQRAHLRRSIRFCVTLFLTMSCIAMEKQAKGTDVSLTLSQTLF